MEALSAYHSTGLAMAAAGILLFVQLLVADIAGMKVPHIPGAPIEPNHDNFIFRAHRALGNMNESVSIFIIFALVGILSGGEAIWLARAAWVYIGARTAYMICYWFNIKLARSAFFGLSLLSLLALGAVMVQGLLT